MRRLRYIIHTGIMSHDQTEPTKDSDPPVCVMVLHQEDRLRACLEANKRGGGGASLTPPGAE